MSGADFKIALLQERITVTPGVCLHALCTHSTEPGHQYCPQCERERRNKKLHPAHLGLQQRESTILFPFRQEQTSVGQLSHSPMPAPLQHFQHVQQKQLDQGGGFRFGDSSDRHGAVNTLGSADSTPQGSQQNVHQKQLDQGGGFRFGDSSDRHGAVNTLGSAGSTPQVSQQFGSRTHRHIQPDQGFNFGGLPLKAPPSNVCDSDTSSHSPQSSQKPSSQTNLTVILCALN